MSLINDALKRARDAERNRPPAAPQPPLAPVDTLPRHGSVTRWILLTLVLIALLLSSISFWKWAHHESVTALTQSSPQSVDLPPDPSPDPDLSRTEPLRPEGIPSPPLPAPGLSTDSTDPAQIINPPPTSPVLTGDAEPDPASHEDGSVAPTPVPGTSEPTPLPREPELRLQSVIYRLRNPAVVINGQMLFLGDAIAGGHVIDIQRDSVTVQRGESNIVLQLPRF